MGSLKRFFSSDFSGFLSASGVEGDTGAAAKGGVVEVGKHQLVPLGGEQLIVGLGPSGLGRGGAGAKAGGAREDQQEREEGGGETLGVQGGWW